MGPPSQPISIASNQHICLNVAGRIYRTTRAVLNGMYPLFLASNGKLRHPEVSRLYQGGDRLVDQLKKGCYAEAYMTHYAHRIIRGEGIENRVGSCRASRWTAATSLLFCPKHVLWSWGGI